MSFVLTWLVFAVLLALPAVANKFAVALANRTQSDHDHAIEDTLPQTAGEWLAERLGDDTQAIVTDSSAPFSLDGYHPDSGTVQLRDETHFKSDPAYWATAAHELGHARVRSTVKIVAWLATAAKSARWTSDAAVGLAVGNVLYGLPLVHDVAFALFSVALLAKLLLVVDEAAASRWAYQELRFSAHLEPAHLRAVRSVLRTAFATYVVDFLSYVVLLSQWWRVEQAIGGGLLAGPRELTTDGWVLAAVASAVCVGYAVLAMRAVLSRRSRPAGLVVILGWRLALVGVIALTWNLHVDPTWAWMVLIAGLPFAWVVVFVVRVPSLPLDVIATRLTRRLNGRGLDRTVAFWTALHAGSSEIKRGNAWLADFVRARAMPGPWWRAVLEVAVRYSYLPLLVALWMR